MASPADDIKLPNGETTNAYGQIEFMGSKEQTAKYIRVGVDSDPTAVLKFMEREWNLKIPNLIISVTGGAANFNMKSNLTKTFRKSLIKAAESTGSWIVSGGTHSGVMLHVGKAVQEYARVTQTQQVVALGIATWGVIHNREKLINSARANINDSVEYHSDKPAGKGGASLDKNHSHFILVDDGSSNQFGKEIEFRAKLEAHIAQQTSSSGVRVLNVCLMVQGGPNSLKTAYSALKEGIAVVVVGGSGGWASILATLHYKNHTDITEHLVIQSLIDQGMVSKDASHEIRPQDLSYWTNMIRECVLMKRYITVFETDSSEQSVRDLDVAILESILKTSSNATLLEEQLKLCLAWNRCDLARDHIFNDAVDLDDTTVRNFFVDAFVQNRHEFVKLFLDYGMKRSFSHEEVIELYRRCLCEVEETTFLHKFTAQNQPSNTIFGYPQVAKIARRLLGQGFISYYPTATSAGRGRAYSPSNSTNNNSSAGVRTNGWGLQASVGAAAALGNIPTSSSRRKVAYWGGVKEVFFLAILLNRREMAINMWEVIHDQLSASVAAFRCLKSMLKSSFAKDQVWKEQVAEHADEYRKLTVGLLDECFANDQHKTRQALTRCQWKWGGLTCLRMINDSHDMDLVAHPSVQYVLNHIWFGGMDAETDLITVAVATLVPTLAPCLIKFDPVPAKDGGLKDPGYLSKIRTLLGSPVVSFALNTFSYMLFLLLFAIVLLFNLPTTTRLGQLQVIEIILGVWVAILALDEINEIAERKRSKEIVKRLRLWISNNWNRIDCLGLILYLAAFVLRFYSIEGCRIVLCLAFSAYSIRLLHIFAIHRALGPKIIMVGKMIRDLVFFMFILLVFLVAYGVVRQALLYPNEWRIGTVIAGVVNKPYWNIYGELFLEEIIYNPTEDEFSCSDNETLIYDEGYNRCPQQQAAVPVLSAIYLLFANVLLLNLLIAMFTYSFDNLIDNSDKIWKMQLFELVEEYYYKPTLCTPLSFFSHLYTFARYLLHVCCKTRRRGEKRPAGKLRREKSTVIYDHFKIRLDADSSAALDLWLRWCVETYLIESHKRNDVETNITFITDRLDALTSSMEGISRGLASQKKLKRRVKSLEEQMARSTEALEWIMTALKDNSTVPKTTPKPVHTKARSSPYPKTTIQRTPVPAHLVSWTVPWPAYDPPRHTDEIVLARPFWADQEPVVKGSGGNSKRSESAYFNFNCFDEKHKIDRTSHMGRYRVVDGLPRNPAGRTGLTGRGLLGRYGPNHAADPIVTRWERESSGEVKTIDGRPVLQFVAVCRHDTGDWAIPGGMVDPGESVSRTLKREFVEEVEISARHDQIVARVEELLKFGGVEIYRGYCDDFRNTDQAWIETIVMNFHDNDGSVFEHVNLKPGEEASGVKWKRIDRNLKLFASHSQFLHMVAQRHNAYF